MPPEGRLVATAARTAVGEPAIHDNAGHASDAEPPGPRRDIGAPHVQDLDVAGRAGDAPDPASDARDPPGDHPGSPGEQAPAFVLVLEGAARAAVSRLPSARPAGDDTATATGAAGTGAGPARPGEVRVVEARGSGDDAIVAVVRELPGRRVVVTADRELRARCVAAGAEILGPGWLLGQL